MAIPIIRRLQTINPWHFVWIGMLSAEILTALLSTTISIIGWGSVSNQILFIGVIDSFFISLVVISIIAYFTSQLGRVNWRLNRELVERRRAEEAIVRRDSILEALSFMAQGFLQTSQSDRNIMACIERLGAATGVDRITIRENFADDSGDLFAKIEYEWDAPGIERMFGNVNYRTLSYAAIGLDREAFVRKEAISGNIGEFPEDQRAFFSRGGIKSLLIVPVFVGTEWWGFIGFADCRRQRQWTSMEMDVMHAAADIIGAAIYRKQKDAELLKARDCAMEASRAKSLFLANMSHEIRTPMNSIIGFTELLEKTPVNKAQREYLHIVGSSANTLLEIINDILDLSKIESGNLKIDMAGFDIFRELEDLSEFLAVKANEKDINLIFFLDPDLPQCLIGDALRLKQILTNLISNAIKFTHTGGYVYIKIAHEPSEERSGMTNIGFSVEDNGIGISKDKQETILEPFVQADNMITREYGGTGLGLTITNNLIRMLGGNLSLESEAGRGARFFFTLAFEVPEREKDQKRFTAMGLNIAACSEPGEGPCQTGVVAEYFEHAGCEIHMINEIGDLLDMGEIDVVFMKIPPVDAEMIKTVRVITNAPIIAIARGYDSEVMEGSFDKVIYQPFYPSKLISAIDEATGSGASPVPQEYKNTVEKKKYRAKALIVEDVPANQLLIKLILEESGIEVDIACNGFEAVEKYRACDYNVVFMDVHMPVCNGIVATQMIREYERTTNKQRTPIIALTADAIKENNQALLADGMDNYITKPINRDVLDTILDKYIGGTVTLSVKEERTAESDGFNITDAMTALGLSRDMAVMCLRNFLSSTDDDLKELRKCIEERDRSAILETVHRIKGTAANLRVNGIASLCVEMELVARGAFDSQDAEMLVGHLNHISRLRDDIQSTTDW
ncbi:MAG TPA: ATP-binding protein [Dissulfurispiraceae bacterium]|nr:ATP-binding protein [Dissulfurispiraceae bacterium]